MTRLGRRPSSSSTPSRPRSFRDWRRAVPPFFAVSERANAHRQGGLLQFRRRQGHGIKIYPHYLRVDFISLLKAAATRTQSFEGLLACEQQIQLVRPNHYGGKDGSATEPLSSGRVERGAPAVFNCGKRNASCCGDSSIDRPAAFLCHPSAELPAWPQIGGSKAQRTPVAKAVAVGRAEGRHLPVGPISEVHAQDPFNPEE